MANMFLKTGATNWTAAASWSATSAGGVDSVGPPLVSTDCIAELLSGNVTLDAGATCRSFDTTSGVGTYGGTITHTAAVVFAIGDATAGAGNVAIKLNSGVTYAPAADNCSIRFTSTSATLQTIDLGGKTVANLTFNTAGIWALTTGVTMRAATTTVSLNAGVVHTDGAADTSGLTHNFGIVSASNATARSWLLGTSTINMSGTATCWDFTNATGLTMSAASSTINFTGAGGTPQGGLQTYGTVNATGSGSFSPSGFTTMATFTRTGTATTTDSLFIGGTFTVTSTLTFTGNSASNRLLVLSPNIGIAFALTKTTATVTASNADFRDINLSGGATVNLSAATGGSGNGGGCSGITFTTPQTNYWVGNGGNYSDAATHWANSSGGTPGSGRVPLLQDTGNFDANSFSSGGQTVTFDMPRTGSLNWTGATNSPTVSYSVTGNAVSHYGSLNLISGMTATFGTATPFTFFGRSSYTFTSGGKTFPAVTVTAVGGTVTLQDALTSSAAVTINNGSFITGGNAITATNFVNSSTATRTVNITNSTITLSQSSATPWSTVSTGLTFVGTGSTIKYTGVSASATTFAGAGLTYGTLYFNRGTSSGTNLITGSNTFAVLRDDGTAAHTLQFTVATTQTIATGAGWRVSGTSGNLISLNSTTTGTYNLTISGAGTVSADYLNIQHSIARPWSGAAGVDTWYAGANSTDNQATVTAGNGWIFTAPPGTTSNGTLAFPIDRKLLIYPIIKNIIQI